MSKRSRSDSASSSSSSSSSSSGSSVVASQTTSISTAKLPASRNLSNIAYRPSRGFSPVTFTTSPLTEKNVSSKEFWAVRIPSGISAAQLDGLVIDLPRDNADSGPLGTIELPTTTEGIKDRYNFFSTSSVKGKKKQSSATTQLIAMAGEGREEEEDVAQGGVGELESLHLLVPQGDGKVEGRMVLVKGGVKRWIKLSIASPAETMRVDRMKENSNRFEEKKLPQQPWHLLKGNFRPAGSRGGEEAGEGEKRKVRSEVEKEGKKSSKKSKKE